jgi:hypothetical protein
LRILAKNPGKRRTEIVYFMWFAVTVPLQLLTMEHLSFEHPNDPVLLSLGGLMGAGALVLPVLLRAPEDRGKPLGDLYGVRMGLFLFVWAVIGGYVGTDPWYEVLHGHFAFNTELNPNGVPLFMLPMTIAVFGAYSVILGSLYRVMVRGLERVGGPLAHDTWWRHGALALLLAPLMPLIETLAYTSDYYCFDSAAGKWGLNVLVYGSWHFAALLFYPRFDREPGEVTPLASVSVKAFATLGVLMSLMALITSEIAPHFTDVRHGVRYINDWSADNCLGAKPTSNASESRPDP